MVALPLSPNRAVTHWMTLLCLVGMTSLSLAAPPKVSIERGTEVSWSAPTDHSYQLQWRPLHSTDPADWVDLATFQEGSGAIDTFLDRQPARRQYRVIQRSLSTTPNATNAIVNGSFEQGDGVTPIGWTLASSIHSLTNQDASEGSFSLRTYIQNQGSTPGHGLLTQQIVPAGGTIVPEAEYRFTFAAHQVSFGPSYVQFYDVQWLDATGSTIASTGYTGFVGGDQSWATVESPVLTAPASATDARIVFYFATGSVVGGHGEVLIDELSLASSQSGGNSSSETILNPNQTPMLVMSWPTESGVTYQPRISSDLTADSWTNLPPITGTGATESVLLPLTGDRAFFQIVVPDDGGGNPGPSTSVVPLYDDTTTLEPDVLVETEDALITYLADRARDRHAREDIVGGVIFRNYDHYLSFYWEQRIANIEIVDRVAKGGSTITFNFSTGDRLDPAEFRTFFADNDFVAQYLNNRSDNDAGVTYLGSTPSSRYPGETEYHYTTTIEQYYPENRPLEIGDRIEVELSQFLLAPRNGRTNYYGTAFLYVVGQGVLPWYAKYKEEATDPAARESASFDSYPLPEHAWLGGLTTLHYQYSNEPEHRFKQTAGNISPTNGQEFMFGRRLHHTDFGDGAHSEPGNPLFLEHAGKLGPHYIAPSCVTCHVNNGRALPPEVGQPLLRSVVKVGNDEAGSPHPILGSVVQPKTTEAGSPEATVTLSGYTEIQGTYGDGTPYTLRKPVYSFQGVTPEFYSVRIAPQLVGLGLLEAVAESTIEALADPEDTNGDGISGRMAVVDDPANPGTARLGRFTAKASQATVSHQIANALNGDMGVTTDLFPILDGETAPRPVELSEHELDQLNRYVSLLGVSARRELTNPVALRGEQLFQSMNCVACHTPSMETSPYHPMAELRSQTIRPYTDLLLHDMGPGLSDNMGENGASGSEWRTAPLWNIGLTAGVSGGEAYLHDGRARTLEEAILWHGGEAEAAKEAFRNLPAADREAVIEFLKSL